MVSRRPLRTCAALRAALLVAAGLGVACRSACPGGCTAEPTALSPSPIGPTGSRSVVGQLGGTRPALVIAGDRAPQGVLLALHGYGDTAANFVEAFGLPALARREGLVLVAPDGTPDQRGQRFWNATDACCNFFDSTVDDVAYLRGLLRDAATAYRVSPQRRYVLGFSNGAFMASRLACEAADEIAAIVPISGTLWDDPDRCRPRSPVSVLQVHGDADDLVRFAGGSHLLGMGKGAYPGAVAAVERWARLDACTGARAPSPPLLDLDREPGAETAAEQVTGCPAGVDVRLLTVRGARHVPGFSPAFAEHVWAWLLAHPKVAGPTQP